MLGPLDLAPGDVLVDLACGPPRPAQLSSELSRRAAVWRPRSDAPLPLGYLISPPSNMAPLRPAISAMAVPTPS
jgi:hypothetical protein